MTMEDQITRYIASRLGDAHDLSVSSLLRIPGGASRETWSFDASWIEADGKRRTQGMILRRDPVSSIVQTDRRLEFSFYESFQASEVPVPRTLWLESDASILERPFFLMERIDGCESQFQPLLDASFAPHRESLGRRMYEVLAAIVRTPVDDLLARELLEVPSPEACWSRELDHWERVIDANETEPQPIVRAAIRWLRQNPPPPPVCVTVVHGDYRTGNFLYRKDEILGILDWEMAHFGDPLEDLAWSMLPTWQWAKDGKVGGLLTREAAITLWQDLTGVTIDPAALQWWDVFGTVKAQAIWLTGAKEFAEGRSTDLIHAFTSYWLINSHDRFLLQVLGRL